MKKQRDQKTKKTKTSSSSSSEWSKSEKEVAEIILDFHCHVGLLSSIPFSWGCKRKRTAVKRNHSPSPAIQNNRPVNVGAGAAVVKVEVSSSATESDDILKRHSNKKTSLIKEKELPLKIIQELAETKDSPLKIVQELIETKDSLIQEVEKVKQYYDKLKSYNLNLKKRKQELLYSNNGPKLEIDQKVQLGQSNGSVNPSKSHSIENEEYMKKQHQEEIQMHMQIFPNHENQNHGPSSSSIELDHNNSNNNGPIVFPDLNLKAEELIHVDSYQPLDQTTTIRGIEAAQARQRRIQIFRLKKPFGNNSNSKQNY